MAAGSGIQVPGARFPSVWPGFVGFETSFPGKRCGAGLRASLEEAAGCQLAIGRHIGVEPWSRFLTKGLYRVDIRLHIQVLLGCTRSLNHGSRMIYDLLFMVGECNHALFSLPLLLALALARV